MLYGPGDPAASIVIDEQSFVLIMTYAKEQRMWPRPPPSKPDASDGESEGDKSDPHVADGDETEPFEVGKRATSFEAEGVLRDALVQLWEKARSRKVALIDVLTIRMFEAGDAFRLLGSVGSVSGAKKEVTIEGGYQTRDGGELSMDFRGPVSDATPIREFLQAQIRDAKDATIEAAFELTFDDGLTMDGDAAAQLTEKLVRFASGAAYVSASAEVKS